MLLGIPNRRQEGGGFAVIAAKMAVGRPTEYIFLERLLPGIFPVLSTELYGFMFSQLCRTSIGAMGNQSTRVFPGTNDQQGGADTVNSSQSFTSRKCPWLRLLLLQKDKMPDSLSRGLA